ncbi:hypothetical protein [Catenovulum agarivorans]|uniref:hypothetical protein n=1 Tax=Catenovulum agarivorans TaxID=1172192 RepID=UPI0002DE6563|nr:hypothetical protein [Catenovulum agarivorans]
MLSIYYAQLKREFWEHKGVILWYPIILSAIAIGAVLIALIMFGDVQKTVTVAADGTVNVQLHQSIDNSPAVVNNSNAENITTKPKDFKKVASFLFTMMCMDLAIFALAIIGNGLAGDRKDGSILFWRSIPVDERDNVLSKFLTALLVLPAFHVIISLIALFVISVMVAISESLSVTSGMTMTAFTFPLFIDYLSLSIYTLFALMWLLPFFAWVGLVSSYANKLGFVWIFAPFVIIPMLENLFLQSNQFWPAIKTYIDSGMDISVAMFNGNWQAIDLLPGFAGLVLSAVLITATIYVRKIRID